MDNGLKDLFMFVRLHKHVKEVYERNALTAALHRP